MNIRKFAAVVVLPVASVALLSACSSGSAEVVPSVSASAAASVAVAPTEASASAMLGSDAATRAPVALTADMNGKVVDLHVGQRAVFADLPKDDAVNRIVVESSNPDSVFPYQQGKQGGVELAASLEAKAAGTAVVTVLNGDAADNGAEVVYEFTVNVS